jgi:SAM-dependent methyltransferase
LTPDLAAFERHLAVVRPLLVARVGETRFDFDSFLYRASQSEDLGRMIRSLPPRGRVLDLGCGKGHLAAYLAGRGWSVRALDMPVTPGEQLERGEPRWQAPLWRDLARRFPGVRYGFYDGRRIPAPPRSFDAVLAYAVLEHVDPPAVPAWLREIRRVMRPTGRLFIFKCPNERAPFEHLGRLLGLSVHERLLGEGELAGLLASAGFRVEAAGRSDLFPAFPPLALAGAWNAAGRLLHPLERVLLSTPLRAFSHHMWTVAVPCAVPKSSGAAR